MPKLTVILTHQLDCNQKYLDLAQRGLASQEFDDFETVLVSGAKTAPLVREDLTGVRTHWDPSLDTATKKIHWAISATESEFILFHSDDVILSRSALGELVESIEVNPGIMNPFSNSDCRSLYYADFGLVKEAGGQGKRLIHDMSFEDIEGWEEEVINFPLGRRILVPVRVLSFYCTLMPRSVWDRVGELDPILEYRHNDQDFCLRAGRLGIPSFVNLAPFAFHFGSKTLSHLANDATKMEASRHFAKKWGLSP